MDLRQTGKTIAVLRKKAGYTQASLAEKLGISDKAVSKWERGISCPDVSLWRKLASLLDSDIESIIYGYDGEHAWHGYLILDADAAIEAETLVYDKPLIHYLISPFFLAGIKNITIVGSCRPIYFPGVNIKIADRLNQQFTENSFVIYGNRFIYGPDFSKHLKWAMNRNDITVLALLRRRGNYPVDIDENLRMSVSRNQYLDQFQAEPFVFFKNGAIIPADFQDILQNKPFAELVSRGMLSIEVKNYDDVLLLSQYVKSMECIMGEKIACIEEILIRRGIAEMHNVLKFANEETRKYLKELFNVN